MPVNSFENYPLSWKTEREELDKPFYSSIAKKLEEDILSGRLPENTKLPPQRELADYLDLNLSTITRAYKMCELKGFLYAVTGRGTFVSPGISVQDTFLPESGKSIELGMIRPFYECNNAVLKASQTVINSPHAAKLLEYASPLGTKRQLGAAVKWLDRMGVRAEENNVLIAAGAQNALSVVLISLFCAGDKIAVDEFTYTNFKGLANLLHIQLSVVETDSSGMSADALRNLCRLTELKGVYLMPTCSNPTGIFTTAERRTQLAAVIKSYGLLAIEDDIYSFLAPAGAKSIISLIPEQTIHICSISKSLCAGLRVAFLAFPERLRERLTAGMLNINLKAVSLNAEIIAELIESGEAEQIVRRKIILAGRRGEIYSACFKQEPPDGLLRFFYWLRLPASLTSEAFEAQAFQKGVHVLGSHRFAMHGRDRSSFVRLSVVSPDTEEELKTALFIVKSILEEKRFDEFIV